MRRGSALWLCYCDVNFRKLELHVAALQQRTSVTLLKVATTTGTIEPSGNKNAALPLIAATLLTDQPARLSNVPRIRDTETLVDLIGSIGVAATWTGNNDLSVHAKDGAAQSLRIKEDFGGHIPKLRISPGRHSLPIRCRLPS